MIARWLKLRVAGLIGSIVFDWCVDNLTSRASVFSSPALVISDLLSAIVHEVCLGGNFRSPILLCDADRCHLLMVAKVTILPSSVISSARKHPVWFGSFENPFSIGIAGRLHLLLSR